MQTNLQSKELLHVAVIMDGNGRWATGRGLPRRAGHRAGAAAIRAVVERAPSLGIGMLTLFAFSADNWRRPAAEIAGLMALFRHYLHTASAELRRHEVGLEVIGRRDRLPDGLRRAIERATEATRAGRRLTLRIALDYSGRAAIVDAARALARSGSGGGFGEVVAGAADPAAQNVDLLIRTGGEQRLSDFLLWEAAYAELWFTPLLWPEFGPDDLAAAVADFRARDRRFGGVASLQPVRA